MTNVQLYEEFILEKTLSAAPRTLQYYKENLTKFNNYVDSVLLGKPYKDITKQDYSKYAFKKDWYKKYQPGNVP